MTFDLDLWPFDHMNIWRFPYYINKPSLVQIRFQLFKWGYFSYLLSAYLTTRPQMTFDLRIWPLTTWTYEGSHIISINQVWFQSDFNFSNEATFTFAAYLTTWPQMTFDLGIWPLTAWTYEGSHIITINQVCYKIGFTESNAQIYWSSHELRKILGEMVRRAQYFSNSWWDQ